MFIFNLIIINYLIQTSDINSNNSDLFKKNHLTNINALNSKIKIDLRYKTTHNFMNRALYPPQARAYLLNKTAESLERVHRALHQHGYGIILFDAYRPFSVTQLFWKSLKPYQRRFVASPQKGSQHNRGCAVDISLYDLKSGQEVTMQTPYDSMTPQAAPSYPNVTAYQKYLRDLLINEMRKEKFYVNPREWWHFTEQGCQKNPILDIQF